MTEFIPRRTMTLLADKFKVDKNCITRAWSDFLANGKVKPRQRKGRQGTKLNEEQPRYVEMLKVEKPSTTFKKLQEKLEENADVPVSCSMLCRTIHSRLSGGTCKTLTRKLLQKTGRRKVYI